VLKQYLSQLENSFQAQRNPIIGVEYILGQVVDHTGQATMPAETSLSAYRKEAVIALVKIPMSPMTASGQ
jgi:hypothetical protein